MNILPSAKSVNVFLIVVMSFVAGIFVREYLTDVRQILSCCISEKHCCDCNCCQK